jgi:hypothetical protein
MCNPNIVPQLSSGKCVSCEYSEAISALLMWSREDDLSVRGGQEETDQPHTPSDPSTLKFQRSTHNEFFMV